MKRLIAALAVGVALSLAVSVAPAQAQYDWVDEGQGYHYVEIGWSDDGWVRWERHCSAGGCGAWTPVWCGPYYC